MKLKKPGKKLVYNREAVMDLICTQLATSSHGLAHILRSNPDLPTYSVITDWLAEDDDLASKYARAKADQADFLADELTQIADETPPMDGDGKRMDSTFVAWQRNRIDVRKWAASKLKPKKYGDRTAVDVAGNINLADFADGLPDPE